MERVRPSGSSPKHAFYAACMIAAVAVCCPAERHGEARHGEGMPRQANTSPAARIPLQQLGYVAPGTALLLQRIAGTTLNFIDNERLLFTFRQNGLMKRDADAQPNDDDQLIHAEVVDIATAKIETSANWRMHDRARYLWPLNAGRFLVRQRDTLFSTDASLELKPFARFPGMLRSVQLSPGGRMLVAETEEAAPDPVNAANADGTVNTPASETALPIMVRVVNLVTKKLIAQTRTRVVPRIPIIETGFLEALHESDDHWMVNYKSFDGRKVSESAHDKATPSEAVHEESVQKIAEITSSCSPDLEFLSSTVVMISTCDHTLNGRLLTAVALGGKVLWYRRTDGHRIWPALAYSADGSRFAVETLVLKHLISAKDPFDREDVLGQVAEVFDTVGGESKLVAPASPVLDSGQNFALSEDGKRFAILHNDAIEIYDIH